MRRLKFILMLATIIAAGFSCSEGELGLSGSEVSQLVVDVAQTSGQLASGTSFQINGSSTDSIGAVGHKPLHHGPHGPGGIKQKGIQDGLNLLAPTDELL